jgi:sensor histidine kinase YesM
LSIRTKLFTFILLPVIVINSVSFFIYQSSKTVQESYNRMMERILLYKQISQLTEESLRALSSYLIDQNEESLSKCRTLEKQLEDLGDSLGRQRKTEVNAQAIRNYGNILATFLDQEEKTLTAARGKILPSYGPPYEETGRTADFIKEEGQHLVDLELSYYQPFYRDILLDTGSLNKLGFALFLLNLLLGISFAVWLSRSINEPISRLVAAARQLARGDWTVRPPAFRTGSEFRILSDAFRQMLDNLKRLIEKDREHLETQRLVKELELKALQSQINPHFLFNTLNVLSKLALLEGAEQTSDLTVSVSNLLRYNLRKLDRPVSLREEIGHAREYFRIQEARFRDRIRFETDIDPRALELPIPSLTIQPVLENAFVHGIENMEQGAEIRLTARREEKRVVVEIADNGAGMEEETRRRLLESGPEPEAPLSVIPGHSTGLGVRNVFKRLRLFYGQDDLVEIESAPGRGTTVRLKLPWPGPDSLPEEG